MSIESRLTELRTKVGLKLIYLKGLIDNFDGIGLSADIGNSIVLGTDDKLFYKKYTAAEIGALYEGLINTNKFTDSLKDTIGTNASALALKADLDEAGKILKGQIPEFTFTNILAPPEATLSAFAAATLTENYFFTEGWLIALQIDDGFGGTQVQNYFYVGGETSDVANYFPVNTVTVHWDSISGKPNVETVAGAQAKADAAEANAKSYADVTFQPLEPGKGLSDENFELAEKNKLTGVEVGATADMSDAEIKAAYENNVNTNGYTDAEKTKLAGLEGSKFKGTYLTITALETAYPTSDDGGYAYVDGGAGINTIEYIWDAEEGWVEGNTTGSTETGATIKTKYESQPDTNAFTDALLAKINSITAIFTTALKTAYDTAESWVSTNGANVLAHVTKFSNNVQGQIPVSQADGSIIWEEKGAGGSSGTFTQERFTWQTLDPNTFPVADSTKITDVYIQGKRLDQFQQDGVTADEWQINSATEIEILIPIDDQDRINVISSTVFVATDFTAIPINKYSNHPSFTNQSDLNAYLLANRPTPAMSVSNITTTGFDSTTTE